METDGSLEPAGEDLLPVRMLNEFAYCPRLFHFERVDGLFADSADTVEGRSVHRRVDAADDVLPDPGGDDAPEVARSVQLSSEQLGLIAKIDLVEVESDVAVPVDTKKGRAPDIPELAYEPERVQVCAQGLLLREHGYRCDHGYLYFAASRRRVRIDFTPELEARTLDLARQARAAATRTVPLPPLVDSPKCPRCSLAGICLPDETNLLRAMDRGAISGQDQDPAPHGPEPRRLIPARDDAQPVYVQGQGYSISRSGDVLVISEKGKKIRDVLVKDISHLAIFGNNQVTTQVLQSLCEAEVPVTWFSYGGWFYGMLHGIGLRNAFIRREQFRKADDPSFRLALAREFVAGKVSNCRTLLLRNHPAPPELSLRELKEHVTAARAAASVESLLGIEGNAARIYFGSFQPMLKPRVGDGGFPEFDFQGRNRRPPRDPINAMLSFVYSLLSKEFTVCCLAVGLDPFVGFYHQPRHGRPALALDLMEEFRPLVADSVVLTLVNNGEVGEGDFIVTEAGCAMTPSARSKLIAAYERRLDSLVTHPVFEYRASYRRIFEMQARLLARVLQGEISSYPSFTTR